MMKKALSRSSTSDTACPIRDFEYSDLTVTEAPAEGESIGYDVTFTVTNIGDVTGSETAQLYLGEAEVPDATASHPSTPWPDLRK